MRSVLFVVDSMGTGKVYRCLAIAEVLRKLFPAIEPHFLAGGTAAKLLVEAGRYPVHTGLSCVSPGTIRDPGQTGNDALPRERERRRLAPRQAAETLACATKLHAERVVIDGLPGIPPVLRRARLPVTFLTDELEEANAARGGIARWRAGWTRRATVGGSDQRFFVGEQAYLATPELREWARRFYRFSGPISGLARLHRRACASLRDDLGVRTSQLLTVAGGGARHGSARLQQALDVCDDLVCDRPDLTVLVVAGPGFEAPPAGERRLTRAVVPELYRYLAVSDACVQLGGLTGLSECAGLGLPTVHLPAAGDFRQLQAGRYFAGRHGVKLLEPDQQRPAALRASIEQLLEGEPLAGPVPFDSAEDQRRSAHYVADLIAEALGRRRPGA